MSREGKQTPVRPPEVEPLREARTCQTCVSRQSKKLSLKFLRQCCARGGQEARNPVDGFEKEMSSGGREANIEIEFGRLPMTRLGAVPQES